MKQLLENKAVLAIIAVVAIPAGIYLGKFLYLLLVMIIEMLKYG